MKVTFPSRPDEPAFREKYSKIEYFTSRGSDKIGYVKLPTWVAELIKEAVESAECRGREDLQEKIAEVLGYVVE